MKLCQYFLFITSFSCLLSCNQTTKKEIHIDNIEIKTESTTNHSDSLVKRLNDSIKLESYYEWRKDIKTIESFHGNSSPLTKWEKEKDTLMINELLVQYPDLLTLYQYNDNSLDELKKDLHFVDVNGDKHNDIVFQGNSGGESEMTSIYLSDGYTFEKIFSEYQYIENLQFDDNKLISFEMFSPGCCADPQMVIFDYEVSHNNHTMSFSIKKARGYLDYTEAPTDILKEPVFFAITKETVPVRCDSYILDDTPNPEFEGYGDEGNSIAYTTKGKVGQAIAYKISNSQEWIFALLPCENSDYEYYSLNEEGNPSYPKEMYGWILKSDTNLE